MQVAQRGDGEVAHVPLLRVGEQHLVRVRVSVSVRVRDRVSPPPGWRAAPGGVITR